MTADTTALVFGAGLIAFGPMACLFFQVTFPKSQLIIVWVTAAFFYLLATAVAAMVWYVLDPIIGLQGAWAALFPGVFFQFVFRCSFVSLYHKVERAIQNSFERKERTSRNTNNIPGDSDNASTTSADVDVAKLRLELNDAACGVAAGTGFGGMHAALMYGTLLASESGDIGVLYQPSCPYMPSLMLSALNCFLFSILDVFWMLFTFFGMRRRLIFPRGGGSFFDLDFSRRRFGSYFGNTRRGGNASLLWVLLSHFLAAGITTTNYYEYGCAFSLPLLPVVVLATAYAFWAGVSKIYMPLPQSNTRLSLPASFSYGSRAEGEMNGEQPRDGEDGDVDPDGRANSVPPNLGARVGDAYDSRRYHQE